jgi:hypothetical protein
VFRINDNSDIIKEQAARLEAQRAEVNKPVSPDAVPREWPDAPPEPVVPPREHQLDQREVRRAEMILAARERAAALADTVARADFLQKSKADHHARLLALPAWLNVPSETLMRLAELQAEQSLRAVEATPQLLLSSEPRTAIEDLRRREAEVAGLLDPESYVRWKEYHHDTRHAREQIQRIYGAGFGSQPLPEEKLRRVARILTDAEPVPTVFTTDPSPEGVARKREVAIAMGGPEVRVNHTRLANMSIREKARPLLTDTEFAVLDRWLKERLEELEAQQ